MPCSISNEGASAMPCRMLLSAVTALAAATLTSAATPYTIDPSHLSRVFDGHGGLSAGACVFPCPVLTVLHPPPPAR